MVDSAKNFDCLTCLSFTFIGSEQYLTPISFNRLKALIEVVEQNQQLMTMVAKLEYENLEFKKLIKDTTYMVDVVKVRNL